MPLNVIALSVERIANANAVAKRMEEYVNALEDTGQDFPYYPLVPKDYDANLKFRDAINDLVAINPKWAAPLKVMCKRDLLFWVNTFGWTYNPRIRRWKTLPMVTYEYQDRAFKVLVDCIHNGKHAAIKKSRDMGATWVWLYVAVWMWLFHDHVTGLIASRNEDLVDKTGDPDSLFVKIEYMLKYLPSWMLSKGDYTRNHLHLEHHLTSSTINGASTTSDIARGGRRTWLFMDEFSSMENGKQIRASIDDVSDCIIYNGTPKGRNEFYEVCNNPEIEQITMHWTEHPVKARGLYRSENGSYTIIDKTFRFPKNFPFIREGNKLHSPWYDAKCRRMAHPALIAQELDIDFIGSGSPFFTVASLDYMKATFARPELLRGEVMYEGDSCQPTGFMDFATGNLRLWASVDAKTGHLLGNRKCAVAVDIATGTGQSNSVITIGDVDLKEKIGEWASPYLTPEQLARVAVSLCKWLAMSFPGQTRPLLGWESNGVGQIFGNTVIALGWGNVYFRKKEEGLVRQEIAGLLPGWHSNKQTKVSLLGDLRRAYDDKVFVDHSEESLKEAGEYVMLPNQTAAHQGGGMDMTSGAQENHGDRVISTALLWRLIQERKAPVQAMESVTPDRCMHARRESFRRQLAEASSY